MEIKKIDNLYAGFMDLTISELYKEYPQFFNSYSVLITCLDSSHNLDALWKWVKHLQDNEIRFKKIDRGFWFDDLMLKKLFELNKTFFGFDEIYLFEANSEPKSYPKKIFTTDKYNFSEFIPKEFIATFKKMGAISYLSDGCGLNLATIKEVDLAKIQEIGNQFKKHP